MISAKDKATDMTGLWGANQRCMDKMWKGLNLKSKKELMIHYVWTASEDPADKVIRQRQGDHYTDWAPKSCEKILNVINTKFVDPVRKEKGEMFNHIPDDVHCLIFEYLSVYEALCVAGQISYRWHDVSKMLNGRHTLNLTNDLVKKVEYDNVWPSSLYQFKHLNLNNKDTINIEEDSYDGEFSEYNNSETLQIWYPKINCAELGVRIRSISVDYCTLDCIKYLNPLWLDCGNLEKIELLNMEYGNTIKIKHDEYLQPFDDNDNIKSLTLAYCHENLNNSKMYPSEGIQKILSSWLLNNAAWPEQLQQLHVSLVNEVKWDGKHILFVLPQMKQLKILELELCIPSAWPDEQCTNIRLPKLTNVSIWWYHKSHSLLYVSTEKMSHVSEDDMATWEDIFLNIYSYLTQMCFNMIELHTSPLLLNKWKDESGFLTKFCNILTKTKIKVLSLKYITWQYITQLFENPAMDQIEELNIHALTATPSDVKTIVSTHKQSFIDMFIKDQELHKTNTNTNTNTNKLQYFS